MTPAHLELPTHNNPYELDVYGKRDLALEHGEGVWVWDNLGRRYLDCVAGIGSVNLGHRHPQIVNAIQRQAEKLISCPGSFFNSTKLAYLEALQRVAPPGLSHAFLSNSGTESVEAALKFSRLSTGRTRIIAAARGFHGRTMGSLSATHHPKYRSGFSPLVPDFEHIPFNDVLALKSALKEEAAAVILEVVQGEGGVFVAEPSFLETARSECDRTGALLIFDEVQTGFGRTGKLFACDHFKVYPDILCLAKSIANGVPMGATLTGAKVRVDLGKHGSTFGGNPLACAAAFAVLQTLSQNALILRAEEMGHMLREAITRANWSLVREVRGLGLMIGLELKTRVQPLLRSLQSQGVLALSAGTTVLRLLPPLVLEEEDLDFLMEALASVLR